MAGGERLQRLLADLDARYRALEIRLPDAAPPVRRWAGVLFRIGERAFLTPLEHIAEVLERPGEVTPIPGTRPWVRGVANHRGTLLPIFDLAILTLGDGALRHESQRVLVVRQGELPCGLAVSQTVGIRHCEIDRSGGEPPGDLGILKPFVDSAYPLGDETVPVLALDRLIADPALIHGTV